MSKFEELKAIAELERHRETLLREIRDVYTLTRTALWRLAAIQELLSGEHSKVLVAYWAGALDGSDDEQALTAEDMQPVIHSASVLCATIETLNAKRPVFGLPGELETKERIPE